MPRRRLAQLSSRHSLEPPQIERLERLLECLQDAPQAPTTITDPQQTVDVHVADSLSGLEIAALRSASRIADLGSGAGFPALVLAVALPESHINAVESNGRKCAFIREMAAAVGVDNLSVTCARAEEWPDGLGVHDVVCARAVAPLGVLCEYAAPLLADGGTLVAWKGRMEDDEVDTARRAAEKLGLSSPVLIPVHPFPTAEHRQLAVCVKHAPTPDRYPRRTGVAVKRPLGIARPGS